jgi:hypothetical protein
LEASEAAAVVGYSATEPNAGGGTLNRDSGALGGVSLHTSATWGAWRVEGDGLFAFGTVDYLGQTQFGLPLASQTKLRASEIGLTMLMRVCATPLFVGIVIRSRQMDRQIQPTPITQGLHEILDQVEWGPLVGAEWRLPGGLQLALRAFVSRTLWSVLDVDFLGTYDGGHLSLAENYGVRAELEVSRRLAPQWAGFVGLAGEQTMPGKSALTPLTRAGEPVGLYSYPGSTQDMGWIRLGLRAEF